MYRRSYSKTLKKEEGKMDHLELEKRKEEASNIKTIEDAYALFYTFLEQDYTDEEIQEILKNFQLPEEVHEEIDKDVLTRS